MPIRLGRYFWKLFLANAVVMVLVVAACAWVIVTQLDQVRQVELSHHLAAQAAALEVAVRDRFDTDHVDELNALARELGAAQVEGVRVTFVLADGTVLGDSEAHAPEMESHADRPEIRQALSSGTGESVRWSHTVAKNMKYIAVRVGSPDAPLGVVRVSMAVQSIAAREQPAERLVVAIALASVLAAVLLALVLALLWSRRIQRLTEAAQSLSRGDLSARVDVVGHDEVALLGRSLNRMRASLAQQLETIDRQRRTLDSLVSQLREGVVVVDAASRVVLINAEAEAMLHSAPTPARDAFVGLSVEHAVPNRKLQDLLSDVGQSLLGDSTPASTLGGSRGGNASPARPNEIELRLPTTTGHRFVLARAFDVRLPGADGVDAPAGASVQVGRALVLTDITELARVMQVKADLAANASHELRTPLSAIRAAVDTLRAIDPKLDPEAMTKFIDVIDRHSARMQAMIGDLLELSRLESGADSMGAVSVSGRALLDELRHTFADAVSAKSLSWVGSVPADDVSVTTSAELLRVILRNLIDNAIHFTEPGGEITVSVGRESHAVVYRVADTGCGIAPVEQQRIFERFYQVGRARSGPDRGTGLGLSIVRHAIVAIGARIELKSTLGQGTRVTLRIPSES